MPKFTTKVIEEIVGKKRYEQLVILPDNAKQTSIDVKKVDGVWDLYEKSLEAKYKGSFNGLAATMNRDADILSLSSEKFKDITPKGETVKEYEIKYQDLRVYAIKIDNGKLIILGGYKNSQKSDISRFRSLKRQYLESLNRKTD